MRKGCVYILSNKSLPGLVKIGFSFDGGTRRASQLSTTGLPHPFRLVFEISSGDPARLESSIHNRLRGFRENDKREFFRIDETSAIMAVIDGWLHASGFDANYFREWQDHINNFTPVIPKPEPELTEEDIRIIDARARETLAGLRALFDEKPKGVE